MQTGWDFPPAHRWNVRGKTAAKRRPDAGTFFQGALAGNRNVFILKFDNADVLQWATYYGGNGYDGGYGITTDNNNNVFVTGNTTSGNFPVLTAASFFQSGYGGGTADAFILKFDNVGNLKWATYYGGSGNDGGYAIGCDNNNNVFVAGSTDSPNFPIQFGGFGTHWQGGPAGSGVPSGGPDVGDVEESAQ